MESKAVKMPNHKVTPAVRRYLSQIGRKGAKKGVEARMEKLTPERRSEIARLAARARWAKRKKGA
jgi:hypothetical protein